MADIFGLGMKTIPQSRIPRLRRVFDERLARIPLMRHPGFHFDLEQEGYREYVFGGRYAYSSEFGAICHDLAHAVEFGPDRFDERCNPWGGFTFNLGKIEIAGREYEHPVTGQATERECRTYGIQARLADAFGMKLNFEAHAAYCAHLCRHMPDWVAYSGKEAQLLQLIGESRDMFSQAEIFQRLEGWFDLTERRLKAEHTEDL
ncbi:hypothetical protein WDL1P1_00568 (plasmid) [Variovorax sp. WDL1]|uniref:hypothetical protein n=2 Tax=Variovorax TaxID=34072 RepID=UPI000839AEC2|nr:hypothetical protein [Variovorax sp. WDL1]PNG50510.1 hypothetical protein CHC06_06134 [Variovorax sp. B2]PNG51383.1 hypothetical protein CHC07_06040 [Variovorax sp. B4]VTV17660.1 hypothetical protein WDL1P1_00568 [Variovorax sp. WDL1]